MKELKTVSFEPLDTGVGRSHGYESDKAFIEAMEAKLPDLPEWLRDGVADAERAWATRLLGF